jgi:hypothetical protein
MTIKKRDPNTGQILEKELSSEQARRMAKARWSKAEDSKSTDAASLLIEAGYNPEDAPTVLVVLSEQIAARGARSVSAVREFMRLTRPKETPVTQEGCARCARIDARISRIPDDRLAAIVDKLRSGVGELREYYTPE